MQVSNTSINQLWIKTTAQHTPLLIHIPQVEE